MDKPIKLQRRHTTAGVDPFDLVTWEIRSAIIGDPTNPAFRRNGLEFPISWSQNATNVVAKLYLRGRADDPDREYSVKHLVDRLARWYAAMAEKDGYFQGDDLAAFHDELKYILLHQMACFNTPALINVGRTGDKNPRISACFTVSVEDNIESILQWYTDEGMIFKAGSGSGANLSSLREEGSLLRDGGFASGPISFMRGADSSAGTIKSAGAARRAAKMVILDVDHPDIEEFINCKVHTEKVSRALMAAGFDIGMAGKDNIYLQYQNANNAVNLFDAFMHAVEANADWHLKSVIDGHVTKTLPACNLLRQIAQATWKCGDPGTYFGDTINRWHTSPATGRLRTCNPCQPGFATVLTPGGVRTFSDLEVGSVIWSGSDWTTVLSKTATGVRSVFRYVTDAGDFVGTPDHLVIVDGERVRANVARVLTKATTRQQYPIIAVKPLGEMPVFDITVAAQEHTYWTDGILVSNCGEFHREKSACTLASHRLTKYLINGIFDIETYIHDVEVMITAMDVGISNAEYPTENIRQNVHDYRELGLGYTDLGALLMLLGLPYDSDEGRSFAAAITALMAGVAWRQSAQLAKVLGPYPGWRIEENSTAHLQVMDQHWKVLSNAYQRARPSSEENARTLACLFNTAQMAWLDAIAMGSKTGFRNAQTTLLAPTGSISFLMDADTTGCEPSIALTSTRALSSGGSLPMVCRAVGPALERLGYAPVMRKQITDYISEHGSLTACPYLDPEHLRVFACALGDNAISAEGHLLMLAAVQPFLDGAVSKTINCSSDTTVEEIERLIIRAWKLELKDVAFYRNGCKAFQPVMVESSTPVTANSPRDVRSTPIRRKLPQDRDGKRTSFRIGDCKGYLSRGQYDDGTLGEIFLDVAKEGSTLAGILDALSIAISVGLQHGVPLETYVALLAGHSFPPSGPTTDAKVPFTSSLVDYIARRLALDYLPEEVRRSLGVLTTQEHIKDLDDEPLPPSYRLVSDSPLCVVCGTMMIRAGSCYVCPGCGRTSGCS